MSDTRALAAPFALPHPLTAPDLLAKYFKVLADATRVRILELLQDGGELSVGELVDALGLSQPKVSNHLACLRWCGFVLSRREHPSVYYRVADERVLSVLALGRALLADNAEHVAACERVTAERMLMQARGKQNEGECKRVGLFSGGAAAMVVVCCGGHALLLGILGGVALGSMLGIAAGIVAAVLLAVGIVVVRRRRKDAACAVPAEARPSR